MISRERLCKVVDSKHFQRFIVAVIVINAVTLGLETSSRAIAEFGWLLYAVDRTVLVIFVVELLLRVAAHGWRFFRDPWNVFDFVIVGIALIPASGAFSVLRTLRVSRLVSLGMRGVVGALLISLPGIASVVVLLALLLYVAAVMATQMFGAGAPDRFGDMGATLFTLFQVATGDDWADIARTAMAVNPWAWIFFVIYLLASTFILLNLFGAVMGHSLTAAGGMEINVAAVKADIAEVKARYDTEDVVHQPIDTAAIEAVSALREWLVDTASERADVRAVVDRPRIEALKREISAEIENTRTTIVGATTAARERFMASKARYVEQVGVPALSRGARVYAFAATALAGFTCTGLLVSAGPLLGDVLMIFSVGLVGVAAVFTAIRRLVTISKTLQDQIAAENDEPDDESQSEPRPGPGKWLSSVIVALAGLHGKWSVPFRILASGSMATALAVFTVGLLHLWDPNYLPSTNFIPIPAAAVASMAFASLWIWARSWRARSLALRSENPAHWPTDQEIKRAAHARRDAVQAQAEWAKALLENGVLPLVGAKIEVLSRRSYATVLPEASVEKLGDITESVQFVPTETSAQLNRILNAMSSGAIGLSGPRGIGKSTLLRMFGDRRFGTNPDDLTLVVPAPTNYNSRDFLVHLFTRMCERVLPAEATTRPAALALPPSGRQARPWWLVMACLGGLLVLGAAGWPMVSRASAWLQDNIQAVALMLGIIIIIVPLAVVGWSVRAERRERHRVISIEDMARHHLRSLRYLETNTRTRTGALKTPTGVELGDSTSRQHAEQIKTYPELVNDFRDFLDDLGLRLRSRPGRSRSRIVICIDELDKIATAEQAERFINDIKTIFGVEGCFFLVAVSEDALASFARRALAVRTTFDSAFDSVLHVRRFLLADTRRLLVQRVLRLPEPFVWLCHSLAGGLPRDINRTVRLMYDIRSAHHTDQLDQLATELIRQDIETVAHGQLLRVSGRVDPDSSSVLRWLAATKQLPLDSARLIRHCRDAPQMNGTQPPPVGFDTDELLLLTEQFRTYLYYTATLVRSFCEQTSSVIKQLESMVDDSTNPIQHLADARVHLSVDPAMAWAAVEAYQACVTESQLPTGETT